jgi:hypothetical protein
MASQPFSNINLINRLESGRGSPMNIGAPHSLFTTLIIKEAILLSLSAAAVMLNHYGGMTLRCRDTTTVCRWGTIPSQCYDITE